MPKKVQDRAAFGSPEVELSGERICVTGEIRSYQGHAEIILHRPTQLTK